MVTWMKNDPPEKKLTSRHFWSKNTPPLKRNTLYIHPVVFHSLQWPLWNLAMHPTILYLHQRSTIFNMIVHHHIKWCMCCPGNVDVLLWNHQWFFSRHVQFDSGFHVMTVNEISCNSFRITLCRVILKWGWRRVRLMLLQEFLVPLLVQDDPFHLRLGLWNCHLSSAWTLSFALSLLAICFWSVWRWRTMIPR